MQKVLAWICGLLLVISGVTALFLFNIERRAFSAETYTQAFEKQGMYVRMPAILAEAIHTSVTQDANTDPFLKELTRSDWEASIAELLPPGELKIISDNALDSVFAYLNNEADSASISLILLKARIAGPQGVEIVLRILKAQPDCTLEQLMQMGLGVLNGKTILCKPPEEMMGLVTPLIETQLQVVTRSIPDEVTLIPNEKSNTSDDPRSQINLLRAIMKWTIIFPAMFLVGVTVLAVRSLHDWLNWWGISFLLIGILGTLTAIVVVPLVPPLMETVFMRSSPSMPVTIMELLRNAAGSVAREMFRPVVTQGIVFILIGAVMVIIYKIRNRIV